MIIIKPPEFYGRKCNVCGDKNALCEINFRNDHNNHGNVVALCPDCAETLAYIVESYKEGKTMAEKEYIEREAAERILYDGCHTTDGREVLDDVVELWHMIQNLPAADVVPVVRCRECKHYNAGFECLIEGYGIERPADYFCADGKRKDGGQDDV